MKWVIGDSVEKLLELCWWALHYWDGCNGTGLSEIDRRVCHSGRGTEGVSDIGEKN